MLIGYFLICSHNKIFFLAEVTELAFIFTKIGSGIEQLKTKQQTTQGVLVDIDFNDSLKRLNFPHNKQAIRDEVTDRVAAATSRDQKHTHSL